MYGALSRFSADEVLLTLKAREASPGSFALIPTHKGWKLVTFSFEEWGHEVEVEHIWPLVAKALTIFWLKPLNLPHDQFQTLAAQLAACPLALPQGTVQNVQGWHVFWADNFPSKCLVTPKLVESAFGLENCWVEWVVSEQERSHPEQKQELRKILKLAEDWPEIGWH